jgi:hypothetical protein
VINESSSRSVLAVGVVTVGSIAAVVDGSCGARARVGRVAVGVTAARPRAGSTRAISGAGAESGATSGAGAATATLARAGAL